MDKKTFKLPLIAMRGSVAFPDTEITLDLSRQKSIAAIEASVKYDNKVLLVSQRDIAIDEITREELYDIGVTALVRSIIRIPGGIVRVQLRGLDKARLKDINEEGCAFVADACSEEEENDLSSVEDDAFFNLLNEAFESYSSLNPRISPELIMDVISTGGAYPLANLLACRCALRYTSKQEILEQYSLKDKIKLLLKTLNREVEVLNIQRDINLQVKEKVDKNQKDFYLREQLKAIRKELGEDFSFDGEAQEYKNRLEKIKMPQEAKDKLSKEIDRLDKIPPSSSESVVARDYIELALSLPWDKKDEERKSIAAAEKILNREHYALDDVKERIIEFLAVRNKTKGLDAPIICLSGPPGVGKTSVAKSVAAALNRKYFRISLGGIRDEAEIRGHRKTYVGAMPGRIITALKRCRTNNPLILLDEIDKMSRDYKGDPSAALLEALDSEQNFSFRDNYLELPFDLSDVLFMCTANDISVLEPALRDRLEVIELSSYTDEEKLNIANKFLIPKQLKRHSLKKSEVKIKSGAVKEIISYYTKEAGVRGLERQLEKICRKAVKRLADGENEINVTKNDVEKLLGKRKYKPEGLKAENRVGSVCGLAWTKVGGTTLRVEVNVMKGTGKFSITGNVGKVMDESAKAALSYIRANCHRLDIEEDFYKEKDIHIHIPEGAVPKDGPSAGVTMTTAMVSALKNAPVRGDVAMTGEITIRGGVLPIGGLKEKVLAAKKAGVRKVIIPADNKAELDELETYAKDNMEFVLADEIGTVLENALL